MAKEDAKLILIVDDEARMRRFMQMNLDLEGYRVVEAGNGLEAINRVREDLPDLVLLDVMMPKLSGFEVCKQIKCNPDTRDVQVIMVTALDELGDHERGVDSGTDEFLTKPVDRVELITRVRSLLQVRELKRQSQAR